MKTIARPLAALVAAGTLAAPALACGDEPPQNLLATPAVKAELLATFRAATPGAATAGPVRGRTYYGSFVDGEYAVATFVQGGVRQPPTIFVRLSGGPWKLARRTHGGICSNVVPLALIQTWYLRHWGGRCFVEPV